MGKSNRKITCFDVDGKTFSAPVSGFSFRPAVYAAIVENGKILLSRQGFGYDFPGGGIEIEETIEEALKREVREETGLDIRIEKLLSCQDSFYKFRSQEKYVHSILIYYLCTRIGGKISIENLTEYEKDYVGMPEWVDLKDIPNIKFYNSSDNLSVLKNIAGETK